MKNIIKICNCSTLYFYAASCASVNSISKWPHLNTCTFLLNRRLLQKCRWLYGNRQSTKCQKYLHAFTRLCIAKSFLHQAPFVFLKDHLLLRQFPLTFLCFSLQLFLFLFSLLLLTGNFPRLISTQTFSYTVFQKMAPFFLQQ